MYEFFRSKVVRAVSQEQIKNDLAVQGSSVTVSFASARDSIEVPGQGPFQGTGNAEQEARNEQEITTNQEDTVDANV